MIAFNCQTSDTIKLCDLTPFQGDLKKRTPEQVSSLLTSLKTEGLMMPFAIWRSEGKNYVLDGHGRLQAFIELSKEEPSIFTDVEFPCVFVHAETEDEARKALLQITSSYGTVTKKGAVAFCKTIPAYKAPAIAVVMKKPTVKLIKDKKEAIVKLKVPVDRVQEVRSILSEVDFITVL